jgi:two-component system, chemotaxis family, protein-glutamate methylesterase/glutaminase
VGRRDIVVIGASAGGVGLLREIAAGLSGNLPAAVFVVLHTSPNGPAMLPDLLAHAGPLPAGFPGDGDTIRPGRIYVAPPDRHLVLEEQRVRVLYGPKQNRHRPAVDVLFRSAAFAHGPRVVGVVLTGSLFDGADGLAAIKRAGGLAVVQDPSDATFSEMPETALRQVAADHVVKGTEIAPLLARLVGEEVADPVPDPSLALETDADRGVSSPEMLDALGRRSIFTCPDCHGTLWELGEGDLMHFRCHVGHGYSPEELIEQQAESFEDTLWAAVRSLEENARLNRRVGDRIRLPGLPDELREKADRMERHAGVLRRLISDR